MKTCIRCKIKKPHKEFTKNKRKKDGFSCYCIDCTKKIKKNHSTTFKGVVSVIYNHQKTSSIRKKYKMPNYSLEDLRDWVKSQDNFKKLFKNWRKSNYKSDLKPSVDRIDDYKPYTLNNIQLMTWKDNRKKCYNDIKNGINRKNSKEVLQYYLNGKFKKSYYSISEASRRNKISISSISLCCSSKRNHAGGYIWKFK